MSGCHAKTSPLSLLSSLKNQKKHQRIAGGVLVGATALGTSALGLAQPNHASPLSASAQLAAYSQDQAASTSKPEQTERIPLPSRSRFRAATAALRGATVRDAVKVAESQVGIEETGGGTKFNRWFMKSPTTKWVIRRDGGSTGDYATASWCDMFVSWVGQRAGVRGMGVDAFTPTHARRFQQEHRWGHKPRPGAVVFFSWSGGHRIGDIEHVGLVVKDNHDGTISTVEGNTDNAVKKRRRDTSQVVGYGYPIYRH